jgi:hypothetical protein
MPNPRGVRGVAINAADDPDAARSTSCVDRWRRSVMMRRFASVNSSDRFPKMTA